MAKLLLVDDEPSILSVLSTLLKAEAYDVTIAENGVKAKELLSWQPEKDLNFGLKKTISYFSSISA